MITVALVSHFFVCLVGENSPVVGLMMLHKVSLDNDRLLRKRDFPLLVGIPISIKGISINLLIAASLRPNFIFFLKFVWLHKNYDQKGG